MTLPEAMAAHGPAWLGVWLNILLLGGFILPLALLIWKPTRVAAVLCIIAGVLSAVGVGLMYDALGYVKILGLPHIVLWTPLAIYLWRKLKDPQVTKAPRIIVSLILATIVISLAFDYTDAVRYIAGERTPLAMPAAG
jgi:hypothetical protein